MKMREEDIPEVREESFRYSGPKPQTKESAIVSLADAVESASRSLEKPTPAKDRAIGQRHYRPAHRRSPARRCDLTLQRPSRHRRAISFHAHDDAAQPNRLSETGNASPLLLRDEPQPDVVATTRKPATAPPVSAA